MKKAVIYARYSCSSQTEQSIEGQLRRCYRYADENNIEVIGKYIDRARSATTDKRPQFQQMLKDSEERKFDFVIVYAVDRFARNTYDYNIDKRYLLENGVHLLSATEMLEVTATGEENTAGIILEGMLSSYAYYYSRELSAKIRRGQQENILKGNYLGGAVQYGYKIENKKVLVVEDEAEIVRKMFQMYADGYTAVEIVAYLNSKGIRNHNGKPFKKTTILALLANEKYIGIAHFGERIIKDQFEPIVSRELFEAVQDKRKHFSHSPSTRDTRYLLTGKLFCGYCNSPMYGESGTSRNGTTYRYYKCFERKKNKTCSKENILKDELEELVLSTTLAYFSPANVDKMVTAMLDEQKKRLQSSTATLLRKELTQKKAELNNLIKAIKSGAYSVYLQQALTETEKECQELEDKLALETQSDLMFNEDEMRAWLAEFSHPDLTTTRAKQLFIDTIINKVILFDDRLMIIFNNGKNDEDTDNIHSVDDLIGTSPIPSTIMNNGEHLLIYGSVMAIVTRLCRA